MGTIELVQALKVITFSVDRCIFGKQLFKTNPFSTVKVASCRTRSLCHMTICWVIMAPIRFHT